MTTAWIVLSVVTALAALAAGGLANNLRLYRPPPRVSDNPSEGTSRQPPGVSILIPARDEAASIAAAIEAALATRGAEIEVVVRDDQSSDRTPEIVLEYAQRDSRVRLISGDGLPAGWCGKQWACQSLADNARYDLLVFQDADVRLAPDAVARLVAFLEQSQSSLVSGVPYQETGTWMERLVIPLIHVVLLCYLPMGRMRQSTAPGFAAGCGQLFLTRREDYVRAGGHAAIRTSLHDGLTLPRAFRRAGLRTDLCDPTDIARCRMYHNAGEVWQGLAKNATEGLAHPARILPFTLLLAGGHIAPPVVLAAGLMIGQSAAFVAVAAVATLLAFGVRAACAVRFKQSWLGVVLHPLGVALLLAIQYTALASRLLGRQATWKGRGYIAPGRTVVEAP